MENNYLFLPIETSTRELEAKLLIALEACNKGFDVLIGSKRLFRLAKYLGKGVFLYKDASAPMEEIFKDLQSRGVKIAVHDEEGFVHLDDLVYVNSRLRFNTIKYVDIFFAWGAQQANLVKAVVFEFNSSCKVITTGHPRIDLLRKPFTKIYPEMQQPTILINTKLAECNHRNGENGWIEILEKHSMIRTEEDIVQRHRQKQYKELLLKEYQLLISRLSQELPHHRIVIRPHPVENKTTWIDYAKNLPNVDVDWSESIAHWASQACVVIHTGCTTGIEAALLDKRVISYKPLSTTEFDIKLPDSISNIARTQDELISMIYSQEWPVQREHVVSTLNNHLKNIEEKWAYQEIVNELPGRLTFKPWKLRIKLVSFQLFMIIKKIIRAIVSNDHYKNSSVDNKFTIDRENLVLKINAFKSLLEMHSSNIVMNKIDDEIFLIKKK